MWIDPVIEEIHQIRQKLMDQAGGDLHEAILRARGHRDPTRRVVKGTPRRPVGWVDVSADDAQSAIQQPQ